MSARSSPKSSAKKKTGKKNAGNASNSSRKINKNPRTNTFQEGEVAVELKNGEFWAQATAENTSKTVRPQPLKVYINVDDMREMRLSGGDFVLVKRVVEEKLKETVETGVAEAALGIAWPMQSILSSSMYCSSFLSMKRPSLQSNPFISSKPIARLSDGLRFVTKLWSCYWRYHCS